MSANLVGWWRARRARRDARLLNLLRAYPEGMTARDVSQGLSWSISAAFAALARLENEGRIISRWGPGADPRRRRLYVHAQREQKRIW